MSKAQTSFSFPDFSPLFSTGSFPGFDFEAVATRQQQAFETAMEVNRQVMGGYQTALNRHMELIRTSADKMSEAYQEMVSKGADAQAVQRQATFNREAVEIALNHVRELAEIAGQTNAETVRLLQDHIASQFKGLDKETVSPAKSTGSSNTTTRAA